MNTHLDARDQELLAHASANRARLIGPRVGDYVLFASGQLERLCHDHGQGLQTAPGGSYHLFSSGGSSFSGGLNPTVQKRNLKLTSATLPGRFWFFHHGISGAGRGVDCEIPCRVYTTSETYMGYLGADFQSSHMNALKDQLASLTAEA